MNLFVKIKNFTFFLSMLVAIKPFLQIDQSINSTQPNQSSSFPPHTHCHLITTLFLETNKDNNHKRNKNELDTTLDIKVYTNESIWNHRFWNDIHSCRYFHSFIHSFNSFTIPFICHFRSFHSVTIESILDN